MKRRFELIDGKSNKFWQYESYTWSGQQIEDSAHGDPGAVISWGKIGTKGASRYEPFIRLAHLRAKEKVKKGYVEVLCAKEIKKIYEVDKKMDEVENAFLKALKDANTMEWGSSEQIKSENLPYALAKVKGWDANTDETFQKYARKATTEQLLAKGLELYRLNCLLIDSVVGFRLGNTVVENDINPVVEANNAHDDETDVWDELIANIKVNC